MSTIIFDADGTARFIYSDELAAVASSVGVVTTRRASHVEPTGDGGWAADMSPVGGPVLGPHRTREKALKAERVWLEKHSLPLPR